MSAPVLQVITSTNRRGAEIFATDLDEALRARGREVSTVALAPGASSDLLPVPYLGRSTLGVSTLRALRGRMKRGQQVVSHGSRTLPACAIASSGTGRRFVYRTISDGVSFARSPARRARVALYLKRASAVVALWSGSADLFMRRYGVPAAKIRTIPNGVPAARFPPIDADRRAAARARLGIPPDGPVVVYLGWLEADKFPPETIAACAALEGARLVVAGDGPDRAALERVAQETAPGLAQFLGVVRDPGPVLAAADVLLLPTRSEGMPAVVIEAGLSGLPVVATDVGAMREVVVDGETGLVVPVGDFAALSGALRDALAAPATMGARAREHCLARFEIGVVAAAFDEVLADLEATGR